MQAITMAEAGMMIRKPVEDVFTAFTDPSITSKFWFTDSTGTLEEGKKVTWTWKMYGVVVPVHVIHMVPNKEILIEWGEGEEQSKAIWKFTPKDQSTYVHISNYDFKQSGDALHRQIVDSVGGFTMVLAGLKAYLEHGIELNLIGDKWPAEMH